MDEREARRSAPLVCVTDGKHHVRRFLREVLSEFDFTLYECVEPAELADALEARAPDLVVLGLTAGGIGAGEMLRTLAARDFDGKVLPFAQRDSEVVEPIRELAEQLGIALLPPLLMPFGKERLRESIAILLPEESLVRWWTLRSGALRLDRTLVSAEDRCPYHRHPWHRSLAAHPPSGLGHRAPGLSRAGR